MVLSVGPAGAVMRCTFPNLSRHGMSEDVRIMEEQMREAASSAFFEIFCCIFARVARARVGVRPERYKEFQKGPGRPHAGHRARN